ncbi:hypothetical protein C5C03_00095 [Clavibacter michiganensis]|nr:hypothetical protein C5C03_00095 [Clavibacter michiganensis]PPF99307.1 hypothetical protein C5C05_01900 [Clavibacter michiganensis]
MPQARRCEILAMRVRGGGAGETADEGEGRVRARPQLAVSLELAGFDGMPLDLSGCRRPATAQPQEE